MISFVIEKSFISFATVYRIDVFIRPIYKEILVDSINPSIKGKGLIVLC